MFQSFVPLGAGQGAGPSLDAARRQLEQDIRAFGASHPATQNSRYNYAEAISDTDPQEAERLHREVLRFKQQTHGPGSVAAGTSYNSLGSLLRKRGGLQEAEEMLRKAVEIREAHPAEWFDAAVSRDELACVLQAAGRADEARQMRLKAGPDRLICSHAPCSKTARQALKACIRCTAIWYCDKGCQRADWPAHKQVCARQPS